MQKPLDGWLAEAHRRVATADLSARLEQVGRVRQAADGVALIDGLPDARSGELLRFEQGGIGLARMLDEDSVAAVLLDQEMVEAGQRVWSTGAVAAVPVGDGLLGRVIDPLGRPLDGKGPLAFQRRDPVERAAPAIIERDLVTQPLATGITVIDALFALGRGQRELILGDRATGKTAIATDTIINQRRTDVICIYAAIGQKSSSVRQVIEAVRAHGDPSRVIFVVAGPAEAPGLQWLAPYAAMTLGEYFRDSGRHALVVLDDLSKHAATHRELALLMRQPAGREAYPGDIFYAHSRLLERAGKLSFALGGGSLSVLPIAETQAGNLTAYIPTNLISITDGQIVLDAKLFHQGQKPAVDVGRSVSRIGGKTQLPALRQIAESLRLDYAQFLELELFTRFSTTLDAQTAARIERGRRLRAVLAQPQQKPLSVAVQIAQLLAVQDGVLDRLPVTAIEPFKQNAATRLAQRLPEQLRSLETTGKLAGEERQRLSGVLAELAGEFAPASAPGGG